MFIEVYFLKGGIFEMLWFSEGCALEGGLGPVMFQYKTVCMAFCMDDLVTCFDMWITVHFVSWLIAYNKHFAISMNVSTLNFLLCTYDIRYVLS